tara:strand:- start:8923 stop:9432 length:510 start_codon:yes stop_codon:yes gene_type:complete
MKIGISQLRKIIMEEAKLLTEGCGDGMIADDPCPACEADESSPCDAHAEHNYDDLSTLKSDDNDMLDKEEALGAVVSIAQNTSCPVTRQALLGAVGDLKSSHDDNEYESSVDINPEDSELENIEGNIENMSPERAFAIGFIMGKSGDFDHMIDNGANEVEDYAVEDTGG